MKASQLTDEQISKGLEPYVKIEATPEANNARRKEFREEYTPFLNRFFRNENQNKIVAPLTKVALLIPEVAIATSLSTGFIAGFEAAVALLKEQAETQQEASVGSQLS